MSIQTETLVKLRLVARRLIDDQGYQKDIAELASASVEDAAKQLRKSADDPEVRQLAADILIGRLMISAGGRLNLGQMRAGKCDCCTWETALA